MTAVANSEMAVGEPTSDLDVTPIEEGSEPTLLDQWRFERRVTDPAPGSDWRSAVPDELFERLRARSAAAAVPTAAPLAPATASPALQGEAARAGLAPMPESYRAPFLPEAASEPEPATGLGWTSDAEELPEEPAPVRLPSAFQGLEWNPVTDRSHVLVSLRPVLDAALAEKVVELLDQAPGMTGVRSLGSDGDVAAFEAEYDGPVPGMEAVSQALRAIGASLVSTGDREFYLAIQGQSV